MASEDQLVINVKSLTENEFAVVLNKSDRWEVGMREILWHSTSIRFPPHIQSSADVDTKMISHTTFDQKGICPEAIIGQIGFSESEPSTVFILYALGAGMKPPTELVDQVQYRIDRVSGSEERRVSPEKATVRCRRSIHERRSEIPCAVCGHPPYFVSHVPTETFNLTPEDSLSIRCHLFTKYAYPKRDPIFSISLDGELVEECFVVFDSDYAPVAGALTLHDSENLSWTHISPLSPGTYRIEFDESKLPFHGNPPATIGVLSWQFILV